MIARDRVKLGAASISLVVAAVAVVAAIAWLAGVHRAFLTGASPRDVFTPVPAVVNDLAPDVVWRPDPALPRSVEPATRIAVTESWTSALGRIDGTLVTGDPTDLTTSFSGAALEQVTAGTMASSGLLRQVPLAHDLEVVFYADDGSIIELRDHRLVLARTFGTGVGDAMTEQRAERWDVVLLLRDGRWRVEQLVRRSSESLLDLHDGATDGV